LLTLFLALVLYTQAARNDDSAVLAAQDARFAAIVAADVGYLERALDSSLTYHHSTGAAQSKAEFIDAIRAGGLKYKAIDVMERRVRRFGSVAIVTGLIRIQAVNNADTVDIRARFTDAYEMRPGGFVQVAWQNTRIP